MMLKLMVGPLLKVGKDEVEDVEVDGRAPWQYVGEGDVDDAKIYGKPLVDDDAKVGGDARHQYVDVGSVEFVKVEWRN